MRRYENISACKRAGSMMIQSDTKQSQKNRALALASKGGTLAETTAQTYANHTRLHPPFHFFLAPGSIVLLILSIVNVVRHSGRLDAWILALIGVLFFVAVFLIRVN